MNKKIFSFVVIALTFIAFNLCNNEIFAIDNIENENYIYLSDVSYIEDKSFAQGNHTIHLDKNEDNGMITLNVDNSSKSFIKGLCAWATSEIVYDLSSYNYDYFTSYIGVDISEQNSYFNTGVKFYIYTSNDGENWDKQFESETLDAWSSAQFVKIDIKNVNYLKLVADDNSDSWWASWYDEAVYANAKLIKENYEENTSNIDFIKTVDEYDSIIKNHFNDDITGDYELTLLQREFVNNVGYDVLQALAQYKEEYKDTINWLMHDSQTLKLYLVGGKPEGSYLNSIKVLSDLYNTYKDDLLNTNKTKYGTTLGDLYRTMMLSLSLTESGNVYLWVDGTVQSDALTRYEIYKNLHLHEGQDAELIENKIFESLTVEEMRWVMNTVIDDEEILWLNDYVRNEGKGATSPYNYITYTFDYDYTLDKYYNSENYDKWNQKYHLSKYNITYKSGHPKLWVVFEEGSVCGGLSKTGSCIWGAYKGLPNTCVSQPAHCAYIYYTQNDNGNGIWNLGNNVSGWGKSGRTEHLNVRTMNDWGNGNYTSGWNANYILLAQAAQNEYEKYEKAEEVLMLADVYKDDSQKLEKIYRKAIEIEDINFDAWLGLVNLYTNDSTKAESDYYTLAKEIVKVYTYYPNPMYDLLNLVKPYFTSVEYSTSFTLLQTNALTAASKATNVESIQSQAVKQVAEQLLGNVDTTIANFSFDGDNAGKIVLSSRYDGSDVAWDYSLDGGITWTKTQEHIVQLTNEEIASITSEKDIRVHIIGVDYSNENIFIIDIQDSLGLPLTLYANDLENKLIGATNSMQWKYNDSDAWTSYSVQEPDLTGDKSIIVRAGATGLYLAGSTSATYTFTKDSLPDTNKYIPIKHLSIHYVSSEQPGSDDAINCIDGNINTIWHTSHNASDSDRTIIIKLDEPVYLSSVQYVPRQFGTNGRAKNAILYVSMDGVNWTIAGNAANWENNSNPKTIELNESTKTQYIKFVTTENWGDGRNFASAAMFNLFEDTTKKIPPTAEIEYTTNNDNTVTAKLVNCSTNITITNNAGSDIYTFTENGQFTFEFIDKYGNVGAATAVVDWITNSSDKDDNKPGEDIDKPSDDNQKPSGDTNKPNNDNQKPSDDVNKPNNDNQKPSGDVNKPNNDNQKPSGDTDKPNDDTNKPSDNNSNSGENNNNNSNSKPNEDIQNSVKDNTISSGKLPNTGMNYKMPVIITLLTITAILTGFITYIKRK